MDALTEVKYALDTFYFLMSGALVMWMAAGFAMLEAGLVRAKNTTEILLKNITLYATACIMYLVVGYQIMYGGSEHSVIPTLGFLLGNEHSKEAVLAAGGEINHSLASDFFFQVVFVATAMSVVSGAVAERMKLWSFLLFAVVMTAFIYPVEGYWKWGGGFLDELGFLDFAGSGIVHMAGGAAAFAGVLLVGPRKGKYGKDGSIHPIPGANLPLATLGTFILWLGWFGFNGGSQLVLADVENANAVSTIFLNTNAAAAAGVVTALIFSRILFGTFDLTMTLNGALAGLVAITAEPLTPSPLMATMIGAIGGLIVVLSIVFMDKVRVDDPVGAISVHGVVGIWGLMAVPLTNPEANWTAQFYGMLSIFGWVFIASVVTWGLIKIVLGLRVSEEDEYRGLDIADCGLEAYPEFTSSHK